jgi:hypothetical protein
MSLSSTAAVDRKPHARSAVTNGKLLPGVDQRSSAARRFRDVTEALTDALQKDGALTLAETALVKQAAALVVRTEALQLAIVGGGDVDDEALVRLTNTLSRTLKGLFARRKGKKAVPGLGDLLKSIEGRAG